MYTGATSHPPGNFLKKSKKCARFSITFFLERVRGSYFQNILWLVVRNFWHIFYEICAAKYPGIRNLLILGLCKPHSFTSRSGWNGLKVCMALDWSEHHLWKVWFQKTCYFQCYVRIRPDLVSKIAIYKFVLWFMTHSHQKWDVRKKLSKLEVLVVWYRFVVVD